VQLYKVLRVSDVTMVTLAINRGIVSTIGGMTKALPAPAPAPPTEAELEQRAVKAVLAGNRDAFQPLVEAHQSRVYGLALRMLGNEREAEDAAQDAFLHAFARLGSYKPEWRFKTWIMTITSNLCIDKLRRRRLEPASFADMTTDNTADGEIDFTSHEPQPDVVVAARQRDAALRAMLAELQDEDRSMVAMFYFNDMSYDEIALALNTTVSAVKSRLFRARQKMAQSKWAAEMRD
jgi:RNA polymerase sigma-70 factor (ECF subfamily)